MISQVCCLELVTAILNSSPPSLLFPVATVLCRNISTGASSLDFGSSDSFTETWLNCFNSALASFPTVIVKVCKLFHNVARFC